MKTPLRHSLRSIAQLPTAKVIEHATPFFWLNLKRLLRIDATADGPCDSAERVAQNFVAAAFDSFSDALSADCLLPVCAAERGRFVFPRLGIELQTDGIDCHHARAYEDPDYLKILRNETKRRSDADGLSVKPIKRYAVPNTKSAYVLAEVHNGLFDECILDGLGESEEGASQLASQIGEAIQVIECALPSLGKSISRMVNWYIPIDKPFSMVHHSFTSAQQGAVIFLSRAIDSLRLAEAIVHEFSHIKLNVVSDIEGLVKGLDPCDRYSPWRDDPRPLSGLIHALFVFGEVDKFLAAHEFNAVRRETVDYVRHRRILIRQRLTLGVQQVPLKRLSPIGQSIFGEVASQVDDMGVELTEETVLPEIADHLDEWRRANPSLEAHTEWTEVGSL